MLTCDKYADKATRPILVQDGWRTIQRGDILTREPIMVEHLTNWVRKTCGALDKDRVEQCRGCQHAGV